MDFQEPAVFCCTRLLCRAVSVSAISAAKRFQFIDFLQKAGQTYWQVLPLGPTGFGDSPYQSFSAFAGNALLISPEKIVEDGFLTKKEIANPPKFSAERVDFGGVIEWKNKILKRALNDSSGRTTNESLVHFTNFATAIISGSKITRFIARLNYQSVKIRGRIGTRL
jgi:hypothetical protein